MVVVVVCSCESSKCVDFLVGSGPFEDFLHLQLSDYVS